MAIFHCYVSSPEGKRLVPILLHGTFKEHAMCPVFAAFPAFPIEEGANSLQIMVKIMASRFCCTFLSYVTYVILAFVEFLVLPRACDRLFLGYHSFGGNRDWRCHHGAHFLLPLCASFGAAALLCDWAAYGPPGSVDDDPNNRFQNPAMSGLCSFGQVFGQVFAPVRWIQVQQHKAPCEVPAKSWAPQAVRLYANQMTWRSENEPGFPGPVENPPKKRN